jgi:hypothetical protein
MRALCDLSSCPVKFPRPLQQGFRALPDLLHLLAVKKRFLALITLGVCYDIFLAQVVKVLALRAAAALGLLVNRRIHVN